MKKTVLLLSLLLLVTSFGFAGGSTEEEMMDEVVKVDVFQFKVEIVDQLDDLVADFEADNPGIDIVMDTVGGGSDYGNALRQRFNSGEEPTVFNIGGQKELVDWFDYLEPLSGEPWINQAHPGVLANATKDGEVYGLPYGIEGYGLIYNKALLSQAGYSDADLEGIDTFDKLSRLFADLESQKGKLGIENVLSFSLGGSAWWTASIHNFNVPWAYQEDPFAFIEEVMAGKSLADDPIFNGYVDLLELFIDYSYDKLNTIMYDDQVANFALGKTAVLQQGNWTIGQLLEIDETLDMGILPYAIGGSEFKSIPVGVPMYWSVNTKKSDKEKAAAKKFLDYMVSSPRGEQFLVKDAKFIPAFKGMDVSQADPLARAIESYSSQGNTIPWVWFTFPNGYTNAPTSDIIKLMQKFYEDRDRKAFLDGAGKALQAF